MKENAKPTNPTVQNTGHLIYPYEYTQKESYASGHDSEEIPASGQMREPGKGVAEKPAGADIFSESFNDMQALSKASSLPYMEKAGLWDKFDKTAETRRQIKEEQSNKKAQRDISLLTSPRYSKFTAFLLGGAGDHTVFLDNKGREYFVPTAKVGSFTAEYPGVKQVDDSGKYTDEVLDNMYTQDMEEEYLAAKPENADRLRELYKSFTPDMGRKERFSAIDKLYREVFDEDLATSIEKQISDTDNRITAFREQFEDEYVDNLVKGKTIPLARFTGAYKPKLLRNLNHAQDLITKINQELRARKNQTGFWKGLADADWSQLLTGDVQTLYDAVTERNLFARIDNYGIDVLDEGEKLLLDALVAGEALRSYPKETTTAHNIGNIVANSAGWIGPFAGSKFLLKGIVAAGKAGAKALARRALGKYIAARAKETGAAVAAEAATETVKKGIKQKAKEWVKKKGTDAVVEMGESAGQLALMPTFYADLANTYNGEIQLKDSGSGENRTFEYAGRKISDTPFRDAFLRNFVTVHVEKLGINIPIFKNIGKAIPGNSRFWRGVRVAVTGTGGEAMKRAINFDGFVGEYVEEMIDGTLNALLVGDQTLEDVYSAKNQIETALSVGVMTFGMGLVSGGLSIPASRKVKKNLINAEEELKKMIPSVEDRQAFIKRVADSDYAGQAEILMEFADKEKSAEARGDFKMKAVYREAARIAANYINSFNRLAAYDSYAAEEIKERLDAERKAIKSASNPDMGGNIIVAAYNGKNVRVVAGNIEFNEDGSVNAAKSSESVVILNDDGTRQQISPQGLRLSEIVDSALLESDAADRITEEVRSEAMATIDSENNREYLTDEQAEYLQEMGIKGVELDEATDAYYVESPEL